MRKTIATIAALGFIMQAGNAHAADEILGVWDADDGESKIKIEKCGSNFCNTIVWLKTPRKDAQNEDASLRSRDLVGTEISNDLKTAGDKKWEGSVYSPKKGKTYSGFATVDGERLLMKGCLTSAGILCQTAKFTRAK